MPPPTAEQTQVFLASALSEHHGPGSTVYTLVDQQIRKRSDPLLTRHLYDAVAHHAAQIAGHPGGLYNELVDAVFTFDWKDNRDDAAMLDAFEMCVRSILSVNATFAHAALRMLTRGLQNVSHDALESEEIDNTPSSSSSSSSSSSTTTTTSFLDTLLSPDVTENDKPVALSNADLRALLAKVQARLVRMVAGVVTVVPTAGAEMGRLLNENFPHRFRPAVCLQAYARAALAIARRITLPSASDIVAGLLLRCVEIDVEIELDEGGAARLRAASVASAATEESDVVDGLFNDGANEEDLLGFGVMRPQHHRVPSPIPATLAMEDSSGAKEGELNPPPPPPAPPQPPQRVDDMAHKLDVVLLELFGFLDESIAVRRENAGVERDESVRSSSTTSSSTASTASSSAEPSSDANSRLWVGAPSTQATTVTMAPRSAVAQEMWRALHRSFRGHILVTHRSKFVQFLLLRFVGLNPPDAFARPFAEDLAATATDQMQPHVRRINALAYLASFLVRSKTVIPPLDALDVSDTTTTTTTTTTAVPTARRPTAMELQANMLAGDGGSAGSTEAAGGERGAAVATSGRAAVAGGGCIVVDALEKLLSWIEAQLPHEERLVYERKGRASPGGRKSPGVQSVAAAGLLPPGELATRRSGVFYAATQAVFYVVCFRGAALHAYGQQLRGQLLGASASPPSSSSSSPPASTSSSCSSSSTCEADALQKLGRVLDPERYRRICDSSTKPLALCLVRVRHEFLAVASSEELALLSTDDAQALMASSDDTLRALCSMAGLNLNMTGDTAMNAATNNNNNNNNAIGNGASNGNHVSKPPMVTPVAISPVRTRFMNAGVSSNPTSQLGAESPAKAAKTHRISTPLSGLKGTTGATSNLGRCLSETQVSAIGVTPFNRANPLGSFFPFDPFLLRMSHRFIEEVYQDWVPPLLTMTPRGLRRGSDGEDYDGDGAANHEESESSGDETGMSTPLNGARTDSFASSTGTRDGAMSVTSNAMSVDSISSMTDTFGFGNTGVSNVESDDDDDDDDGEEGEEEDDDSHVDDQDEGIFVEEHMNQGGSTGSSFYHRSRGESISEVADW